MGVRRVVHDQVGDDPDPPAMSLLEQLDEVVHRAELGQHRTEIPDVVPAVAQRRVVERRQPQAIDAQPRQVVELLDQAAKITDAVVVGVVECSNQHLIEHRFLEPVVVDAQRLRMSEVVGLRFDQMAVGSVLGVARVRWRHRRFERVQGVLQRHAHLVDRLGG